jgi:glycosyltransferase involved in cell wall biosynthesis
MGTGRTVAIWRSGMLAGSETFIRNQGGALARWRPVFLGARRIASPIAADTDVIAYPATALGRASFLRQRLTGDSPRIRRVLTELDPALVHGHFGGDTWLISGATRRLRLPLVVTVHGYDITRQPNAAGLHGVRYRRNLHSVFDRAALILAVSQFIRDRVLEFGADPAKVRVHHTGVALPEAVDGTAAKQWDLAFVGRFVPKKGLDDLIEAVATLAPLRPRLLLVGGGPLESQLRERARVLGLDVTFAGVQPPERVQRLLAESAIFVSPSKTAADGESEGLPTTILEAAALGLPVISTYHSGIPEAVVHGRSGLLGAEGDRAALAEHLTALLGDEALRRELGAGARQQVETNFDLVRQTALLEQLYDAVADGRAVPVGVTSAA